MSSSSPSSWKPLPLHRNLSTVGIGPVFICPPSHYKLPPSSVMCDDDPDDNVDGAKEQQQQKHASNPSSSKSSNIKTTWEITGDIKSTPQDFIVREIGWCPPPPKQHSDQEDNSEKSDSSRDRSYMNKYTRRKGWRRGIAGLTESDTAQDDDDCKEHDDDVSSAAAMKEKDQHTTRAEDDAAVTKQSADGELCTSEDASIAKKMKTAQSDNCVGDTATSMPVASSLSPAAPTTLSTCTVDTTKSPDEILRQVLIQCHDSSKEIMQGSAPEYADNIMKQLASLQNIALEELKGTSTKSAAIANDEQPSDETKVLPKEIVRDDSNSVWITTSKLFKDDTNKGSWKLLHETLRKVYPLLRTENAASRPPQSKEDANVSNNDNKDGKTMKNPKNAWVRAVVDDCFFPLIPYLLHPAADLLQLYTFRSVGPVISATNEQGSRSNQTNNRKKNRWKTGKRDNRDNNNDEGRAQTAIESNEGKVLLHLKPDIPRTERRNIHQIITGKNNRKSDFETSTRNDASINNGNGELENASAQTTTAIVVQWSRMALQNLQKKRKREESSSNSAGVDNKRKSIKSDSTTRKTTSPSDINALFCTLKKEQVEHQVALQSLMRALKCRPGDIGLAGIKDMKAITYQFCTLRNVDMKRAQRPIFDERVNLSNFVPVQNFLLDRGRLLGNQFEITIRNLRQVERLEEGNGPSSWKERAVPIRSSHLDAMVDRVAKHGFINYYGEQRVGDAGQTEFVGVRSFDVGRAILKQNFSLAVDLIMEGRSSNVYNPTQEEMNTRQTWKTTNDARATLKEFPKSRNVMVRERDLMRGLLRYGDSLEAVKTVPHNTRTFWVHAYQSFVWNKVATERVRRYGIQPIEGDLYFKDSDSDVHVVTDPNTVNISQVVLPLPGYTIQYPTNEIGDLYREILAADGVQLSVKNDTEESSAKGSYRKLIQQANNLKWDVAATNEEVNSNSSTEKDPVVDAARFTFELESGCYATMMLRELMLTTLSRGNGKC
ncbi:pseudouridine synthase, TruD family [Skeletonema marinoi]|uniref:Pseudouridine synthase, TruD family n=1 Tax=Skeletonema marinoi TaxID=267567 RepID=A0AAD8Y6T8_9STRA|nr:pseudouridine synthase, TruD family [Skeletonema marinoi]